ncbi:TLC domain containing 3Ba [Salarias fasciatus]|uniref:TLC domain containing 3Ba n=1 Tax=Salarias fasciatus TaxID=181472 RepID=UPI0011768793|nr:ceramide synthase-like [Salarias fasciatus]
MFALVAAGSVFFPGLFLLTRRSLRRLIGWSDGDAAVVATRLLSSLQAVMASSVGCVVVWSCSDIVEDRHWLTDAYIFFATPYFAYDVYAMYLCHHHRLRVKGHEEAEEATLAAVAGFLRRESLMVLHHVFLVAFCFPASVFWRQGKGDYFQALLFLAELSTPSVSLGKVLIQYNRQHTLLHRANGLVLLLTFFCCRVLLFPYLYYAYSRYASVSLSQAVLAAPWQCNLGAGLLWPLQLYWFSLICRRALGQFSRRPPGNATAGRHGSPLGNTNTANQSDGHRG